MKGLICTLSLLLGLGAGGVLAAAEAEEPPIPGEEEVPLGSTADHSQFGLLEGPFERGPEVTEACLTCHTEAAKQVQSSIHWTWRYHQDETGQTLGKRYVINNLCMGVAGNYDRCTSCHVGYGWSDREFDFEAEERVDCLACHDTTGEYVKFPTGAGHPPSEDRMFQGELITAPDLARVAQHVGPTSRETCGSCHFEGGGGDAVKHGDLDSSLLEPPRSLDVHMSPEGADFSCSVCHEFSGHIQKGSRYHVRMPEYEDSPVAAHPHDKPACVACHGSEPHEPGLHDKLNAHGDFIACQTCHVPEIARGGLSTKTLWDWSEAGRTDAEGERIVERNEQGRVTYDTMKGAFAWEEDYPPTYRWFDGNMRYTLLDDPIDPQEEVPINQPLGEAGQEGAKIWPFKVLYGRQPYDAGNDRLVAPKLYGREGEDAAYWRGYDWDRAIRAGMEEAQALGQTETEYSGEYGFVDTRMYWPVNHMVAPAEESVACGECHSPGGRMAEVAGVYVPGQDRHPLIERIGWVAVGGTLLAVLLHGGLRFYLYRRRQQQAGGGQHEEEQGL
ncbi:MAG: tetrathionate reductase family octaheme c-type cytochrome [Halorhodospira sp.]